MSNIKNKFSCNSKSILSYLCLLMLFICTTARSQNNMFLEQIESRTVVRENYSEKGTFLNKQTFTAGKINTKNGLYEIWVITELFDKNNKSTDKYRTSYRCKPNEASIMLMAYPFSNPKSKETEINTISKNFKNLYDLKNLIDVEIEMTFDSGLLNFFGSKSTIKIYNRKFNGNNNIKSKINIKAYALGIRIKQLNYTVSEQLNANGLLIFQKFTEGDGSYFTMNYK